MQQYPPNSQPTVPNQPINTPNNAPTRQVPQPYGQGYAPVPPRRPPHAGVARPQKRGNNLMVFLVGGAFVLILAVFGAVGLLTLVLYGGGDVLPNVSAAGVDVGGMSRAEAATALANHWQTEGVVLRDGDRTWAIDPNEIGLGLDSDATANAAYEWGRSNGGFVSGISVLFSGAEVEPRLNINLTQANNRLNEIRDVVELPAKNAGIQLVNGQPQAVPPIEGRVLDIDATLAKLQTNAAAELADGALDLVMVSVAPAVTDASPLLAEAQQLLSSSLSIEAYDPISDEAIVYTLTPQEWSAWLVASQAADNGGLALSLDQGSLRQFLDQKSIELGESRYLDIDASIQRINNAIAQKTMATWIQIRHTSTTYVIKGGDTFSSIGYDLGIPYPWIQAANAGIGALNPGQTINIPSADELIPLPVVRNKRIVVSISQQQMWAYENGQLKWNWLVSTGIARSPTSPGIFQIQSHEINAYGGQWNLYMPHFMGVYHPGPGVGVMNGFHGFPTDANGGYLLWTNSLGSPATYGCILLSLENAEALYNWAEEGVVVEIQK